MFNCLYNALRHGCLFFLTSNLLILVSQKFCLWRTSPELQHNRVCEVEFVEIDDSTGHSRSDCAGLRVYRMSLLTLLPSASNFSVMPTRTVTKQGLITAPQLTFQAVLSNNDFAHKNMFAEYRLS